MRFPLSLLLLAAATSQLGATDCGQITRDQGFDLWCGDVLCTWKLERGEIKKVGTWNAKDSGVEMIGPDGAPRKGIKDAEKINQFVAAVRAADRQFAG